MNPDNPTNVQAETRRIHIPIHYRIGMLIVNTLPLLHMLLLGFILFLHAPLWPDRILFVLIGLYLLPPLTSRIVRILLPVREGKIKIGERGFFGWWIQLNLQVLYARLPWLEELLRLVPGLYSAWLRLWGARIGRLTYWSAGTTILERPFLDIGDDVILGAGVRLNAHVLARDESGELELQLGTIKIGDRSIVGGYSLLTAGTEIAEDETTRAFLLSPPFSKWKNGKRKRD